MRLYIFISLFFIGSKAETAEDMLQAILANHSNYIPSFKGFAKCGEGADIGKKICVPYHRCNGDTNTIIPEEAASITGAGIFDIRENENVCPSYLDVCCKFPPKGVLPTSSPTPPVVPNTKRNYCGIRNPEGLDFKIIGQTDEAEYGEFPWMVVILKVDLELLCGGSLIAPSVILTAAHCVHKYQTNLDQIKIRAGEWDALTKKERLPHQDRTIRRIVIHKDFHKGTLINDIALLILNDSLDQSDNIGTICLPPSNEVITSNGCFASGWGKREFGNKQRYTSILKKVQLPTVARDKCQRDLRQSKLGPNFVLHNSFICAGGEVERDTCTGDGGSPLACPDPYNSGRYLQAGIVAWGVGCGQKDLPGVYVNVPSFRDWIDQQMNILGLSTKPYIV